MIVNKERLKEILSIVANDGIHCHVYIEDCNSRICGNDKCISSMMKWLTKYDIQTALEEGAHIVNDRAIFPPQEVEIEMFEVDEE